MAPEAPDASWLADARVGVFAHVYASGPAQALVAYLIERSAEVELVSHPFAEIRGRRSELVRHGGGNRVARRRAPRLPDRLPEPLRAICDVLVTLWWGMRMPRLDLVVATDALLAVAAVALRRLGRIGSVVFWTIDYAPDRFGSSALNAVYRSIDRLAVRNADETWNVSPRIEPARRIAATVGRQRVVPMGARPIASSRTESHRIVFVGHLLEKQGVQCAIAALPLVLENLPHARLAVVGDGPFRVELERQAEVRGLGGAVDFLGYLPEEGVERELARAAIGVALYDPEQPAFSTFADSGKIKLYVAAALPVITTIVPYNARDLERRGAAFVVDYNAEAVAAGLNRVLSDSATRVAMSRAARAYSREFEWTAVLDSALMTRPGGHRCGSRFEHSSTSLY